MKILSKIVFLSIFVSIFYSCSNDDTRDYTDIPEWDKTPLSYTQDVVYNGGVLDAMMNFTANGTGKIYYAIVPADGEYNVTAEGLRQEYGKASGAGISGQVDGGAIVVDGELSETIDFVGERDTKYILFSTADNAFDYVGDLTSQEFEMYCNVNPASNYATLAYSEDLGMALADAIKGKTDLEAISGTCNQYYVESLWGDTFVAGLTGNPDYEGSFLYPAILTINDDYTVEVSQASDEDAYVAGGKGTYDPETKQIVVDIKQALFTTDFSVKVIMNK